MILKDIWLDVKAVQERDPAARSALEVLLLYQGVHALIWHRFAHWFYKHRMFFIARLISQIASLIVTFTKGSVPEAFYKDVDPGLWVMLIGMMLCGVYGGIVGKKINKKIPTSTVDKLLVILICVIMGLCCWNIYTKLGLG